MLVMSNSKIATKWYDVALILGLATLMTSCSKDDLIVGDYKLYDLDGSNQAIIGGSGMVSVSDVTSYYVDGHRIYFETGNLGVPIAEYTRNKSKLCRYGFIETSKGVVVQTILGDQLQKVIINKLSTVGKGFVHRSCVLRFKELRRK
jgi:hypothetical protein